MSETAERPAQPQPAFTVGDRVRHDGYGPGTVLRVNAAAFVESLREWTSPSFAVIFDGRERPMAGFYRDELAPEPGGKS